MLLVLSQKGRNHVEGFAHSSWLAEISDYVMVLAFAFSNFDERSGVVLDHSDKLSVGSVESPSGHILKMTVFLDFGYSRIIL